MKRTLCILLALLATVMIMSTAVFATNDAADTETVEIPEDAVEIPEDAVEIPEEAEEAPAVTEAPAEEDKTPVQVLEITVNKDGSSTIVYTMPVPKEYEDQIDYTVEAYSGEDYTEKGIKTEVIDDYEGLKAIRITQERKADQPCSVSVPSPDDSDAYSAWIVKGLFTKKTIMNATYDLSRSYYEEGEKVARFIVHLPKKASEHNAEKVDGKTYEWTLEGGKVTSVRFIYNEMTLAGWIVCAVAACLAVIVLLVILLLLVKMKKKQGDIIPDGSGEDFAEGLDEASDDFLEKTITANETGEEIFNSVENEIEESQDEKPEEDTQQ